VLTESAARELSYYVALNWTEDDRDMLGPLVDAALVWSEDDCAVEPVIGALWRDGLREDIERALAEAAVCHAFVARLRSAAEADLAAGPRGSRLARAVVWQGAFDLAHGDLHCFHCLLCVEEQLVATPESERRSAVLRVAQIAGRVVAVSSAELRSAIAAAAADPARGDLAAVLATDERRSAVRSWLENLAQLGACSVPTLAGELGAVVRGPLPAVADDQVWREAVLGLTGTLDAEWN
jgi:hypothetical protein